MMWLENEMFLPFIVCTLLYLSLYPLFCWWLEDSMKIELKGVRHDTLAQRQRKCEQLHNNGNDNTNTNHQY